MSKALTTAQMREADRRAIEELGIPSVVLMDNAGKAVYETLPRGPVGIVCGKGNNGGDGFVVARYSLLAGRDTTVILVGELDGLTPDATIFRKAYENLGGSLLMVSRDEEVLPVMTALDSCNVLVDALLGTGIQGEVRGLTRRVIDAWPKISTVAVDIPSGLNADTGEVCGSCVRARKTVTFQFLKQGFNNALAADWCGDIIVADIGIPEVCGNDAAWEALLKSRGAL